MSSVDPTVDATELAGDAIAVAPPDRIAGRYDLLGLLGTGGMGSVYRVRDLELGEDVALKFLHRDRLADPAMLARFREEVRLARKVTHAHVARTYDIGEHAGERFLTMELIDGEPLSRLVEREGALPIARAIAIGVAVCDGLDAAHTAGVIHRDVKPDNVLVGKDGRVVITDFGIAHAHDAGAAGVVGTPAYMAPELLAGGAVDARADLYALGAVLFELVTGKKAWAASTFAEVLALRRGARVPDPRAHAPAMPDALAALIVRCLAIDPAARFPSAAAVRAPLAEIHGDARVAPDARIRELRVAPAPVDDACTVAVIGPRNAGSADDAWLADELTDAVADLLCAARGVRVRPRGVVGVHPSGRDPRDLGRALDVHVVVDGTLRRVGDRIHIGLRAISVVDGFQLWARRFDVEPSRALSVSEDAAAAIAEALATQVPARPRRVLAGEAVQRFLRARAELRRAWAGTGELAVAVDGFAALHAEAPDDPEVIAHLAMARARQLNYASPDEVIDADAIRALAERAVAIAPDLGEPWLALATIQYVRGEWADAVRALRRALERAPGNVRAHEMLGHIEAEVGLVDQAIFRLDTARSLDPTAIGARLQLAVLYGLLGQLDRHDALLLLPVDTLEDRLMRGFARTRSNMMRGERRFEQESPVGPTAEKRTLWLWLIERGDPATSRATMAAWIERETRPGSRLRPLIHQITTELLASQGDREGAIAAANAAAAAGLHDLLWLDRHPLFDDLRDDDRWPRAQVRARVQPVLDAIDAELR